MIFKHWRAVASIFASVVVAVTVISFLLPPVYQASAKILVKLGREHVYMPAVTSGGGGTPVIVDALSREEQLNSEIQMLKSRSLSEQVIGRVGVRALYPSLGEDLPAGESLQLAVMRFVKALRVEGVKKSSVIEVKFENRDPVIAARVVNVLIDAYIGQYLSVHTQSKSHDFFGTQVGVLNKRLKASEKELDQFRNQHSITALGEQKNTLLKQISDRNGELARTKAELSEQKGRRDSLQSRSGASGDTGFGKETDLNVQAISAIRSRVSELRLKEQDLLSRYSENSALVANVRREIEKAEQLLAKEEKTYHDKEVRSLNHTVEALRQKEEAQRQQQGALQQELSRLAGLEMRVKELERQFKLDEDNYQLYVRKMEEGRISEAMDIQKMVSISVVEPASPPFKPEKPRKALNIALSFLLGGALAVGAAFLLEQTGRTFNTRQDVEHHLGVPVLASIPESEA